MVMSNLLRNETRLSDFEKSGIIIRYNIYKYKEIYMVDNIGSGNKFDAAWKEAKAQLIKDGNSKPSTQDILHYLIDKWKPQNNDPNKIVVQGFHLEHDSTPQVNTKYGANIGCQQDVQETVTKYGANIGCQQDVQETVTKYGANIGCQQDVQETVTKYGANIGCQQGAQETPVINTKYGANIGCGDRTLKINPDSLEAILDHFNNGNNTLKNGTSVSYDRTTGTLHINRDNKE